MAGEYSHIGGLPPAGRLTVALSSGAGLSQLAIDLVAARESLEPITTAYPVCVVIISFNCFQLVRCAAARSLFWTQGQIQSKPPTFRFLYGGHQVKLFFVLHFYPLNWIGAADVIIVLTPLSLRENTELTSIHYFFSCTQDKGGVTPLSKSEHTSIHSDPPFHTTCVLWGCGRKLLYPERLCCMQIPHSEARVGFKPSWDGCTRVCITVQ